MANPLAKFCPGCGHPLALMFLDKILKEMELSKKAVLGLDIGCSLLAWDFININTFQTHHGRVTPVMVGFKRARPDSLCVGYTGDGGAYAIGWQSLFHAARRDEPIMVMVINNAVYGMTGGQSAPTSFPGQITETSPEGYKDAPMLGPEILKDVAHEHAFIARTAVNDPKQAVEFTKKAIETQLAGHFSLVEYLAFCPTNWKTNGRETMEYLEKLKKIFKTGVISGGL
jgi:2-oxoglutarate ferredoxin oxidoreductase subunit beta